ncbi:MAG: efflux RND transporter permease subunit [bacterium]
MTIPEFSVNKRVTIGMFALILVVMGVWALWGLGLDLFPDIEYPMVTVTTIYGGAGSQEVEKNLTEPLERFVGTVNNLKKITSVSREGISILMLEFEWGTNVDFAAQDVREAIDAGMAFLPEDINKPNVSKFDITAMPVMTISVYGMDDTRELKKLAEEEIAEKLKRVDGVASVLVFGGDEREVQITVNGLRMRELGISTDDIAMSLVAQNLNMPAGFIEEGHEEYLLRTVGEFKTVEEISNIAVGATDFGEPIYLRDVAEVEMDIVENRSAVRANSKPAVSMVVFKQSNANTVSVGRRVKKALEEIWPNLPDNIEYDYGLDMEDWISDVGNQTSSNAIVGGLLAVIMIWLFLRNLRPTFAIATAIPLSVVATFIPLRLGGFTLNIMTLGGLALGVGMLVDNAVVVIENIYRFIEKGRTRIEAAKLGASQVAMAITASTLTTIAVFMPMVFSSGLAGQLTRGLALTITFALLCSLLVSLTIVPMIASILFRKDGKKKKSGIFDKIKVKYTKALTWAVAHPIKMFIFLIIAIVLTAAAVPLVGTEFFPKANDDMVMMTIKLPVGTRVDETDRFAKEMEDLLFSLPETDRVLTMVGQGRMGGGGFGPEGSNEAFYMIAINKKRDITSGEYSEKIRAKFPDYDGVTIQMSEMGMSGGSEGDIDIKIFGDDLGLMRQYSLEIAELVKEVPGAKDVRSSVEQGKPEIEIRINKEKASRLGLPVAMVASQIRTLTLGTVVSRLRERSGEEIDMRVRLRESERLTLDDIQNLPISTPMGEKIPLKEVADFVEMLGPVQIQHEQQTRVVHVYANRQGRDVGSLVADIEKTIKPVTSRFGPGYDYEISGEQEQMQDAFKDLVLAMILAIILVYAIMASLFESLVQPMVIMITLPLAALGVMWIFLITGATLSVVSFVGAIILAGIVVNNGIVLVDHTNKLREEGLCEEDAIIQSGTDRIRPVLITALTTMIGMFPMAIASGSGSEMSSPMALTVIGGLFTATILTLFYVPIFYKGANRLSLGTQRRFVSVLHGEDETNGINDGKDCKTGARADI